MPINETVLVSIYSVYPRHESRKDALASIEKALMRICEGEIDGKPRSEAEAIEYLRQRTFEARVALGSREKKYIPHPTSYFNQARYLIEQPKNVLPEDLDSCAEILSLYPGAPSLDSILLHPDSYIRPLLAVERALSSIGFSPDARVAYLRARTRLYYGCVAQWPPEDRRFIPNAERWFNERRFEQDESAWRRNAGPDYHAERDQIRRLNEG